MGYREHRDRSGARNGAGFGPLSLPRTFALHGWLAADGVRDTVCGEGLCIEVDFSLPAERVIRSLDRIIEWRGKPGTIRVDNGPEYISGKLMEWAEKRKITIQHIQPGHACERALQFEFTTTPKDEGQDFSGQSLRIFAIGHALEDLAVAWLRGAGFDLYTRKGNRADGGQFGFSVAGGRIRGHVDGIIAAGPEGFGLAVPALWECKTMNAKNWRACVKDGVTKSKPVYAAQIALYQAYMEGTVQELPTASSERAAPGAGP